MNIPFVECLEVYKCLCDATRLRILNLLRRGPLCVCHFQEALGEPQAKVSKQLGYLKSRGLVHARRHRNWMIYSLPEKPTPLLRENLKCLQNLVFDGNVFQEDLDRLRSTDTSAACM